MENSDSSADRKVYGEYFSLTIPELNLSTRRGWWLKTLPFLHFRLSFIYDDREITVHRIVSWKQLQRFVRSRSVNASDATALTIMGPLPANSGQIKFEATVYSAQKQSLTDAVSRVVVTVADLLTSNSHVDQLLALEAVQVQTVELLRATKDVQVLGSLQKVVIFGDRKGLISAPRNWAIGQQMVEGTSDTLWSQYGIGESDRFDNLEGAGKSFDYMVFSITSQDVRADIHLLPVHRSAQRIFALARDGGVELWKECEGLLRALQLELQLSPDLQVDDARRYFREVFETAERYRDGKKVDMYLSDSQSREVLMVERDQLVEKLENTKNSISISDNVAAVEIFYATDRKNEGSTVNPTFTFDRADELTYGIATVTIPREVHKFGEVETPKEFKVFSITFYREKHKVDKHFTLHSNRIVNAQTVSDVAQERLEASQKFANQAFIFVHGFNVDFDSAVFRMAQMVHDLGFDGAPFVYSWPSAGAMADYIYDYDSSRMSASRFENFLQFVRKISGVEVLHVVAHSMGSNTLTHALKGTATRVSGQLPQINELILAAADIDRKEFEEVATHICKQANGVTVYASTNDRALLVSKSLRKGIARLGDVPRLGPFVMRGIDTIDASAASTDFFGLNHSYYAYDKLIVNDIGELFLRSTRPPHHRSPILKLETTAEGAEYWKVPH